MKKIGTENCYFGREYLKILENEENMFQIHYLNLVGNIRNNKYWKLAMKCKKMLIEKCRSMQSGSPKNFVKKNFFSGKFLLKNIFKYS